MTDQLTRIPSGGRLGGVGLVLGGALSVHFGSAVAALLIPQAGVAGVVTLRLGISAVLLLLVCRPRLSGHSRSDWLVIVGFGAVLAAMNGLFYAAIARIPLGVAVTIEVLGPLTLSVLAGRGPARWVWAGLAAVGVVLLGEGSLTGLDPVGLAFALGAATMWACYILLSARTGARFPKADGVALAMVVAAALTLPWSIAAAGPALLHPTVLAVGAVVALLASVLPYTLEVFALRRLPTAAFAVMMSLGPAIATVAGYLVLGQALSAVQGLAVVLVVVASAGAVGRRSGARDTAS